MSTQLADLIQTYKDNKAKYRFFEINGWNVTSDTGQLVPVVGMEALMQELEGHHIREALITNEYCLAYNAGVGNEQLLTLIAGYESVHGAIVWAPELAIGRSEIETYLERMIENKVGAVRMFPIKLNFSLKKWQVGHILAAMEVKRLPLIIWHKETSWDAVQDICSSYPQLPVIVEGNDQKLLYHNRFFIPLLEACPNLYIETHNLIQHGVFEYIVNERGIDRLLFGSYFPYNDPNSAMMMITDADIPEQTKFDIAGGHMRRLIKQIARN
jgi:predicted TIM-barrel fold metal-dependent hydrolase